MATKNNPWCGLAPYQDPIGVKHTYKFCGRNQEISDLATLIDNNLFVTLYGRTGVGKTSLLNAGVFPVLRKRGYYPIYIRLSQEATGKTYAEAIINKIKESGLKRRVNIRTENLDPKSKKYLWHYFCTTKFRSDGQEIYPVIVLDQFEEIFFSNKKKAELLLQQIYVLLSDDLALPEGYSADTNYRFVASIREDNLFYLEDGIDEFSLDLYKENRYRLRPLSNEKAKTAILEPGFDCIDRSIEDAIADKIIEISKDEDGTISSLILSLVCSLMYGQAAKNNPDKPIIMDKQIPSTRETTDGILLDFYMSNTTRKQRKIIEEALLTSDGHRKPEDAAIPDCDRLLANGARILQEIETDTGKKIEIVHDRLAKVIYMHKRRRDSNKFRNITRIIVVLLLFLIGTLAVNLAWTPSVNSHSPLAQTITKYEPDTIFYNDERIRIDVFSDHIYKERTIGKIIKEIHIGESISNMNNLHIYKDSINIVISIKNNVLKWDSVYVVSSSGSNFIGYLHNVATPQNAIYMQREPKADERLRLPIGIDTINYKGKVYLADSAFPKYGEKEVSLNASIPTPSPFINDKHIVSVKLNDVEIIPESAFYGCINLSNIDLSGIKKIGSSAFENCINLKEVDISKQEEVQVGSSAFESCYSVETVKLPRNLKGSTYRLFSNCYDLQNIMLPDTIENIAKSMFSFCNNIETIDYNSQKSLFHLNPKDSITYYDSTPVIYNKMAKEKSLIDTTFI
ncbi:MAG: leucine-rich repeat protein, partial [Prevotella sp.]|nr:leucine-rich repeat protein [Prevotella sp.]